MRTFILLTIFCGACLATSAQARVEGDAARDSSTTSSGEGNVEGEDGLPTDYKSFGHRIVVDALRGGSYEKEGLSKYYFKATVIAQPSAKPGDNAAKKLTTPVGTFGEAALKSLDMWKRDEKAKSNAYELRIDGDFVREQIARAMLDWSVGENEISLTVEIEMWRRAKRFGLLGEDILIAKSDYQLVPLTDEMALSGRSLTMSDSKGSMARLSVKFDKSDAESKAKKDK